MNTTNLTIHWTFEQGQIWANCDDGRRVATWSAEPQFACFVDLLNAAPSLGRLLFSVWPSPD